MPARTRAPRPPAARPGSRPPAARPGSRPRTTRLPAVRRGGDRGQVAVEFAGAMPLILLLVVAAWQCVLIGYGFSLAGDAADQAARAGAVRGDAECREAGGEHVTAAWAPQVRCLGAADGVYRVEVRLTLPVLYPGLLDLGVTIPGDAGAAMEREAR
ncbi:TadE/TadG family type IV pilus assembly protein [Streptomyces sp. NPDC051567]|uniref:TadE/TadG family type IV pilus assembly protein n=1 Tax=Streptomyces sp. NPDC051567 TaxID=3365660 RepID=UPI00379CA5C7